MLIVHLSLEDSFGKKTFRDSNLNFFWNPNFDIQAIRWINQRPRYLSSLIMSVRIDHRIFLSLRFLNHILDTSKLVLSHIQYRTFCRVCYQRHIGDISILIPHGCVSVLIYPTFIHTNPKAKSRTALSDFHDVTLGPAP